MDGLTNCLPFSKPVKLYEQLTFGFEEDEDGITFFEDSDLFDSGDSPYCLMADWTNKTKGKPEIIEFRRLLNR